MRVYIIYVIVENISISDIECVIKVIVRQRIFKINVS